MSTVQYPRVSIKFCSKCKWNLRAAWYLQELLQTFDNKLGEVALIPFEPGVFRVEIQESADSPVILLWDRQEQDGFPDSKILKQLVRNAVFPNETLGHVDKSNKNNGKLLVGDNADKAEKKKPEEEIKPGAKTSAIDCVECNEACESTPK